MADSAPRCSVVVPAYNAGKTLDDCLRALTTQTCPSDYYEVIVVDDGSTDNTPDIATRHDVRLIRQKNQGPAAARNNGAAQARGDIVLFTDSDCLPGPDWVELMLAPFKDPEVTGVQGAYLTRQTQITSRFAQVEFEDRYELMATFPDIDLVATYAAGYRRKIFQDMGGFDTSFPVANNEDTEFSYRLCDAGHKLIFVPEALVHHRHPDSPKRYLRIKYWRAFWRIIVYRKFPEKAVKDRYTSKPVKFQTLFMLASFPLLPVALFWSPALVPLLLLQAAIPATGASLIHRAWRKDRILGLSAPLFIHLRAAVLAAGSLHGILACLLGKK